MRLFVALRPPLEAIEDLQHFLEPRLAAGEFRWTPPEHWHLTLAFMPEVAAGTVDGLIERLDRAARRRRQISLSIAGGGAFPQVGRAKVLWAGVHLDPAQRTELARAAVGARAAASRAGAAPDGGPFEPHLTLARLRRPIDVVRWVRLLETYHGPAWSAEEMLLIQSHLGQGPHGRPRHEPIAECRFSTADRSLTSSDRTGLEHGRGLGSGVVRD